MSKDNQNSLKPEQLRDKLKMLLTDYTSINSTGKVTAIPQVLMPFYGSASIALFVTQLMYLQGNSKHWCKWVAKDYTSWEEITSIKEKALRGIIKRLDYVDSGQFWVGKRDELTGAKPKKVLHLKIKDDIYLEQVSKYLLNLKRQNEGLQPF
jgi:hypothetical protein